MNELVRELCTMSGLLSDLSIDEKVPVFRKSLIEFLIMVNEKIIIATQFQIPNPTTELFQLVMENIQDTGNLITLYRQNTITFSGIFDHLVKITNELDALFAGVQLTSNIIAKEICYG